MNSKSNVSQTLISYVDSVKNKKGNLIMVLHKIQEVYGFVSREHVTWVSEYLEIPQAQIYGVLTFYHYFKLKKPGKHIISVCTGTACYLKGSDALLDELKNLLGIQAGETTIDGNFSIEVVRCLGCCGLAPVIKIDDKIYGNLTKKSIHDIIARYTSEDI